MDKKITGIIGYLGIIGWIVAYVIGDREGAEFHLNQALGLAAVNFVGILLGLIPFIGILFSIIGALAFVFEVIGIYFAATDQDTELPVIGSYLVGLNLIQYIPKF